MNLIPNHGPLALARLAEEFRVIPEIRTIILAKARQTQDVENALFGLYSSLGVDNAGAWLLGIYAKLVGLGPGTRTNDSLRRNIKALIKLNRSSGTVPEILEILTIVSPASALLTLSEAKAQLVLRVSAFAMDEGLLFDLTHILGKAKLGGVRAYIEWSYADDAHTFALDDAAGGPITPGLGLGDATDLTIGGELSGVAIATP